jgi:pimeloyl-ACP methyl ester carboxylesterase
LLPLLKADANRPAFHIVAPSLPNFGLSSGVTRRGFGLAQYAEALHKLMIKLGYDKYGMLTGDSG